MKRKLGRIMLFASLSPLFATFLTACGSSSGSSTTTSTAAYTLTNGQCVATGTTTVVAMTNCTSTCGTTGAYTWGTNGQCVVTGTTTLVDPSNCTAMTSSCSTTTSPYAMVNGTCYLNGTTQAMPVSMCAQSYNGTYMNQQPRWRPRGYGYPRYNTYNNAYGYGAGYYR